MAGVACFSGRVAAQQPHTDVYAFVQIRQAHRFSQFALAAPSQRLRSTRDCKQGVIVARAAIAMPELGVGAPLFDRLASNSLTRKGCSSFFSQLVVMRHNVYGSWPITASTHTIIMGALVSALSGTSGIQSSHPVSRSRAR